MSSSSPVVEIVVASRSSSRRDADQMRRALPRRRRRRHIDATRGAMSTSAATAQDARRALRCVRDARAACRDVAETIATTTATSTSSGTMRRHRRRRATTTQCALDAHAKTMRRAWKDEERACRDAIARERDGLEAIAREIRCGWRRDAATRCARATTSMDDAFAFAARTRDAARSASRDLAHACAEICARCDEMAVALPPSDARALERSRRFDATSRARATASRLQRDAVEDAFGAVARELDRVARELDRTLLDVARHVDRARASTILHSRDVDSTTTRR